jgi:hypothetical protein
MKSLILRNSITRYFWQLAMQPLRWVYVDVHAKAISGADVLIYAKV